MEFKVEIRERYYRIGFFRIEMFRTKEEAEKYISENSDSSRQMKLR